MLLLVPAILLLAPLEYGAWGLPSVAHVLPALGRAEVCSLLSPELCQIAAGVGGGGGGNCDVELSGSNRLVGDLHNKVICPVVRRGCAKRNSVFGEFERSRRTGVCGAVLAEGARADCRRR